MLKAVRARGFWKKRGLGRGQGSQGVDRPKKTRGLQKKRGKQQHEKGTPPSLEVHWRNKFVEQGEKRKGREEKEKKSVTRRDRARLRVGLLDEERGSGVSWDGGGKKEGKKRK